MHRIDTSTAQVDKFGAGKNGFTGGNPQTGELPTALDPDFFDSVQEEIASVIEAAGLALSKSSNSQLLSAMGKIYLLPAGIPLPYPLAIPPAGWLICNGSSFSGTLYPALAKAFPSLVLPDLRGEFIRGWDNGRGVDTGRVILSAQGDAIRNITAMATAVYTGSGGQATGAMTTTGSPGTVSIPAASGGSQAANTLVFDASRIVPTAGDNRPRNIAFNYIVRAA